MDEIKGISKVKIIGDRVLVEMIDIQERFGKLYIPPSAKEQLHKARIVGIGEKVQEGLFKVGEVVLISWYVGIPIDIVDYEIPREKFKIMRPDEILCKWIE